MSKATGNPALAAVNATLNGLLDQADLPPATSAALATPDGAWPEPVPLIRASGEPQPYPLDALPDGLRDAVEEVLDYVQAPEPLVACSALSILSVAVQPLCDVRRDQKLQGPVGLFFLTIGESGERKSACDLFFRSPLDDHIRELGPENDKKLKAHEAALVAWKGKEAALQKMIRNNTFEGEGTATQEAELQELYKKKPEHPLLQRHTYTDSTPEALIWSLANFWPCGGVLSAEAGIVFGSHGMGRESIMRNLSLINELWGGARIEIDRKSSPSFTLHGGRLTLGLLVQPLVLDTFSEDSGGLARGSGFFARFLLSYPASTQGTRFYREPQDMPALDHHNRQIAGLLRQEVKFDAFNRLAPVPLDFTPEGKQAWATFHDAVEKELAPLGEMSTIRDVASKSADNVARLAALFHVYQHGLTSQISHGTVERASRIVSWHLNETLRVLGRLCLPDDLRDAVRLQEWLVRQCRQRKTDALSRRDVQQYVPSSGLRKGGILTMALNMLEQEGHIRQVTEQPHNRKLVRVNPALLQG